MSRLPWIALVIVVGSSPCATAQQPSFSTVPTQTVYEYQLNYHLPWQRYWGGPGLSVGGTMPTQGAFGYSSLNGIPFPAPLGAGVYVNSSGPPPNMPGAMPFGPGPMSPMQPMGSLGIGVPSVPRMSIGGAVNPPPVMGQSPNPRPRQRQAQNSPPGARRASVEQQKLGDESLHQELWNKAYVHYRNATELAPERSEAHFRLGIAFAAMKQYSSAIRSFKRSLDLDPSLPQSGETLATIFGTDNKVVEALILPAVAGWTSEDLRDNDRLFLLGLLLHFDEDPRGSEILEAALRTAGGNDYILAFVSPTNATSDQRRRPMKRPKRDASSEREPGPSDQPDDLPPPPAQSPLIPPLPEVFPDPPPT